MGTEQERSALVDVEFTMPADVEARSVAVAGDFNDWSPTANPLLADDQGAWRATVPLPPGRHRFRYVIDGQRWENDWAADDYESNDLGEQNSIKVVIDPRQAADAEAEAIARETSAEQIKPDADLVAPPTEDSDTGERAPSSAPAPLASPQPTGATDGRELQQGSGQPSPSIGEQQQSVDPRSR